jgi:hypothetical protein
MTLSISNLPLAEQWHRIAMEHVDAEAAAQILEESKGSVLSERVTSLIRANPKMSIARAEAEVKGSIAWHDYIQGMVAARKKANKLRVEKEFIRMQFSVWISDDANHRMGARIS